MKRQYTLSLGVCPLCSGNPVIEFDTTWETFSASICECQEKTHLDSLEDGSIYLLKNSFLLCQNCGVDLEKAGKISPNFGNFCSKGCALETKVYSIRLEMYGPSEEEEDSEEDSQDEWYGMTQNQVDECIYLDNEIHGGAE